MADEPANPSWHPALMPNTESPSRVLAPSTDDDAALVTSNNTAFSDHDDAEAGADAWLQEDDVADTSLLSSHDGNDHDARLSSNGDPAEGGVILDADIQAAPADAPTDQTEAVQNDSITHDETQVENGGSEAPAMPPAPTHAQHSSSPSFARTVSHEVSFGDEDEGDWSLPRRDTDTFKFLGPSDRTNSFPVVPPIPSTAPQGEQPLPSNQALDVMEATERDLDAEEHEYQESGNPQPEHESPEEHDQPQRRHAHSRSIGGDFQGFEVGSNDNRFEEGVPLISQEGHGQEESGSKNERGGIASFDDDNNDDDDFFTKPRGDEVGDDNIEAPPAPLARKSTMQVLGSMTPDSPARVDTVQEALYEEDEEEAHAEETAVGQEGLGIKNDVEKDKTPEDLEAKWQQAFGGDDDDEDFLDEGANDSKALDASAFWGSDDEGFLDDADEAPAAPQQPSQSAVQHPAAAANPYLPPATQRSQSYTPGQATVPGVVQNLPYSTAPATPFNSIAPPYGQQPPQRPEVSKAQSFADKAKGGYTSPYDLPTDLVSAAKPRKRPSVQQLSSAALTSQPPPPPRSASMLLPGQSPAPSPLTPTNHQAHDLAPKSSTSSLRNNPNGFFEDLPMTSKPRPSSRASNRVPSPAHQGPGVQLPSGQPPLGSPYPGQMLPPPLPAQAAPQQQTTNGPSAGMQGLVAPDRVSPYAPVQNGPAHVPAPPANASRYSPAPPTPTASNSASAPPVATSRYSPAPAGSRPNSSYNANAGLPSPSVLPHLPRTSSPLAHFEINNEKPHAVIHGTNGSIPLPDRRSSSSYEPRLTRVSSLPPTREVEEEEDQSASGVPPVPSISESKHSPVMPPPRTNQTPPLPAGGSSMPLSPPKRAVSGYTPYSPGQGPIVAPRSFTQSPGGSHGNRSASRSSDFGQRSASVTSPTSPVMAKSAQSTILPMRSISQSLDQNMVPPTDGREHDPLERWKGSPIFTWGVGGTVVTIFPKSVPRYGMNQSTPSIFRTPGEVSVKNIKDIAPLSDRLAKFPGPLKKSKKKETLAWLAAGIESQQKNLPDISFHSQLSTEAKRSVERLLLWQILRVFIEHDGALEGSPAVEKAVRDLLSPGTEAPTADNDAMFPMDGGASTMPNPLTSMQSDGVDSSAMEQIRHHLLRGDREAAVWAAADKRLWGHAMLLSNTVSPDLYKQVAQEFVRKEVNYPGHSNQSLGALYKVLSGNFDDCVDELVPSHARAGLQLVSTVAAPESTNVIDGLDKWRETLTLILSNRCNDDFHGIHALGNLLASYGRAEAAHICFLFSRKISVFGGLDDPNTNYVLLGSDHRQQADQFAKDLEAVQLSEVFEFGLLLAGGVGAAAGAPHLASYKLHHATVLAEHGFRDKALSYCDGIATAITSQTKRSPYHHAVLETAVENFSTRLKQAPKGETSAWISKGKVSDTMWNRFNKFVAGDENEGNGKGGLGDVDSGPFGRIATPIMSRSPSVSNFDAFAGTSPGYQPSVAAAAPSMMASRYGPMASQPAQAPAHSPYEPAAQHAAPSRTSLDRSSGEFQRSSYEPAYPGMLGASNAQSAMSPPTQATPVLQEAPSIYPSYGALQPPADLGNQGYQPPTYGYEPANTQPPVEDAEGGEPRAQENTSGGYEPPSFQPYSYEPPSYEPPSYEPPSYEPDAERSSGDGDDAPKPKKKSFMDDDEDDIPALRSQDKSKSDKDRENEEMFRKAAEEDAKRAAAQQASKKGWGFGGWFGKKSEPGTPGEPAPAKAIRAKLGEESSFVYDPDLKRWVNKKPGAENVEVKKATPPPPRSVSGQLSARGTPPPPSATPPPMAGRSSVPPPMGSPGGMLQPPNLAKAPSMESLGGAPPMGRTVSGSSAAGPPSAPPSRPTTSMSNASSIDDLLSAAGPRKPGQKKPRKSGRYVDVMAK